MTRLARLGSLLFALSTCALAPLGCGSDGTTSGAAGATASAGASVGGQSASTAGAAGSSAVNGGSSGAMTAGQGGSAVAGSGSAGMSSAGAGGSSSTAGAGGMSGAGTAGAGGATSKPSMGCGMAAGQATKMWIEQPKMQVAGKDRQWWVWLPNNYDPMKAYPTIFLFHGCSAADNVVPMQNATNDQAILVRGAGISTGVCWDQSPTGVDVTFFDQMLTAIEAQRCVDTSRIFTVGYSSGSWLVNSLDCVRSAKIRGAASVSGGVQYDAKSCSGEVARIFIHDSDDPNNNISGSITERTRLIGLDHCSMTTMPDDPSPCVRYQGCDAAYPIDWCQTSGKMHDRQDSLAPGAFWKFFQSLP